MPSWQVQKTDDRHQIFHIIELIDNYQIMSKNSLVFSVGSGIVSSL